MHRRENYDRNLRAVESAPQDLYDTSVKLKEYSDDKYDEASEGTKGFYRFMLRAGLPMMTDVALLMLLKKIPDKLIPGMGKYVKNLAMARNTASDVGREMYINDGLDANEAMEQGFWEAFFEALANVAEDKLN